MILGYPGHAPIFKEIENAVSQLTDRVVAFNAHYSTPPPGTILFNLENIGSRPDSMMHSPDYEIWDFSKVNLPFYPKTAASKFGGVKHVPIGYHPSMHRFARQRDKLDIDVVFAGSINNRRAKLFSDIERRGFRVVLLQNNIYGSERDQVYARARLALNIHFYTNPSIFEAVRVSHLVANLVPVLTEDSAFQEELEWGLVGYPYKDIADKVEETLAETAADLEQKAYIQLENFKLRPMSLPR